ncbi:hypothetical protein CHS0354_010652 [Potamilus streckersoni]|uniref:Profilin n=1 Tax=Potamilus streckersoni TaxID=2493646 RepID=A0AAE0WBU1_9BIVA|nr:hypothetical protein CHS0354_010652 [Potamilus streckersoni]
MSETSWDSYLDELKKTGKIERAALIDHEGSVLTVTPGLKLTVDEVKGILTTLAHKYTRLIKLNIGQEVFTCFQNVHNNDILIGRAEKQMLTIQKCKEFVVVGLADFDSPGSCIYEVTSSNITY